MVIESLESFKKVITANKVYVHPIPASDYYHPKLNKVVALYVYANDTSYIVPIDHPEGLSIHKNIIENLLREHPEVIVPDKKEFLYYFAVPSVKDLRLAYNQLQLEKPSHPYLTWVNGKFNSLPEVNKIVPLVKLLEIYTEHTKPLIKKIENFNPPEHFSFYNDIATGVFYLIEQHGLKITYSEFIELFKPALPEFNIKDNVTYTNYNLNNITSRPTNAFNSVNYAAIPKKEEYRKCFLPQNDYFVEFDFDGYHLRLIANEIGYTLTPDSAHKQLAQQYLNKVELTQEEYDYAKQINFQAVYGNVPEQFKEFSLFKLIEKYINGLWGTYQEQGYVNAPISKKRFDSTLEEMHPKKLFNYLIQSLETSRNILILRDVLKYLKDKKTKIALYTYDSVLLDFSKSDEKQTLNDLENILSENNKYPVKFKYSKNLVL